MKPAFPGGNRGWLVLGVLLTVAKLWLVFGQGVIAIGPALHDDRLFINLAAHLIAGDWLGPYNELTLAKGPFYPMFIAVTAILGVPLFTAQHLFYAVACAALVRALRPAIASGAALFAIYALLLANPMTYQGVNMGRVLRQHVYAPLGMLVVAGLIALYLRRRATNRRPLLWAALTGLAAACFHLTREETLMFAPGFLLLAAACAWGAWREPRPALARMGKNFAVIGIAAALPLLAVSFQNWRHYGWFGTCEMREPGFAAAYGAMLRVRVGPDLPMVPVTREAREAMARVSPRFAELQHWFDQGLGRGWASNSSSVTKLPEEEEQIGGGWMLWALRDATARARHATDARESAAFYRAMAEEINEACDRGELPAGPPRKGFMPRWRPEQNGELWETTWMFFDFIVRFSRFSAFSQPSEGSPEELALYARVTHERLTASPEGPADKWAEQEKQMPRLERIHLLGKLLRPLLFGLFLVAQLTVIYRLGRMVWHRTWSYPLTLALATWGTVLASAAMHALIQVTSFPVEAVFSFFPVYPFLLLFVVAVFWDAIGAFAAQRASQAKVRTHPTGPVWEAFPSASSWRGLPWLGALLALAPWGIWHDALANLMWHGRDFELLHVVAMQGEQNWIWGNYGGNYEPLFRGLWVFLIKVGGGSYVPALTLLWFIHALNAGLFSWIVRRMGFSWVLTAAISLAFATSPSTREFLGEVSNLAEALAISLTLAGLGILIGPASRPRGVGWPLCLLIAALGAAASMSFSRGDIAAATFATALLVPALIARDCGELPRRALGAAIVLLPTLVLWWAFGFTKGVNPTFISMGALSTGISHFLINPWQNFLPLSPDPFVLIGLGLLKVVLLGSALTLARGSQRYLLLVFLTYDFGNSLLLGSTTANPLVAFDPRHHYASLLATLPAVAVLFQALVERLPSGDRSRRAVGMGIVVASLTASLVAWSAVVPAFVQKQGVAWRETLAAPRTDDPGAQVPLLPFMHVERAKALVRAYELH